MTKIASTISYYKFFAPRLTLCSQSWKRDWGSIFASFFCSSCSSLLESEMLSVFSSSILSPPKELVAAGSRTPSPRMTGKTLVNRFMKTESPAVSVQINDLVQLAYTHNNESALLPRYHVTNFMSKFSIKIKLFDSRNLNDVTDEGNLFNQCLRIYIYIYGLYILIAKLMICIHFIFSHRSLPLLNKVAGWE